ncbi:ClbS/DfsB family four-helix bundle protein [Candidatus Leptofilum sp.]|uniref:ClbS/DfsB family four-helix bundle protein n=1 Tax=Candidatus Leptofilum sp. TaxID=3241576 RepID=UPI003B594B60
MSTKMEQLLDALDSSRERLLVALDELPDEALLEPNTVGDWSVADLLVQQTVWESELVTGLLRISQGKKPGRLLAALNNAEEYGRLRYQENKDRDLDRVFDDLPQVRVQVEEWLEEFSEKQLSKKGHFSWLKNRSLADLIAQLTYEHELRYLPQVEALAAKWQAPTNDVMISLMPKDEPNDNFAN